MSELSVGALSGLAANSYVIDVASGSSLDLSNGAVFPAGSILQVVSTTKTDTQTGSVASQAKLQITDLNTSFAVSSTSNKVLIWALVNGDSGGTEYSFHGGLTVDGTLINLGDSAGNRTRVGGSNGNRGTAPQTYMNSVTLVASYTPGTTASKTYGVALINCDDTTETLYVNRSEQDADNKFHARGASTIILQEVAG